jgi:2-polyprenyl-6-methoxyphenol hydroxylase-like FAD-dependent oxidoreductase
VSAYASAHGEGPGSGAQETYLCHRLRLSDAERRESGVVSRAEKRRRAATFLLLAHSDARTTRELDLARRFPLGPDAHVAAYPIKAQNAFNIVTTHISNTVGLTEDWTARASKDIMLKRFEGWTETLLKCLRLAPPGELVEWALRIHLPLTGWIDGNTVLLADAAHATLPHIAQGAAQAGEDAAVLSTLLAKCQSKEEVPAALRMYEKLRKPRADWAVEMARITGTLLCVVVAGGHLSFADADLAFFRGPCRRESPHGGRCCSKGAR